MNNYKIPDGTEVYWDAVLYDAEDKQSQNDLSFYLAAAKKARGPVLELACGTGRLTLALARAGINIAGLDVSQAMLEQARKKAVKEGLKADLIRGDARSFRLKRKFKLIFIPFNSMQHLSDLSSLERFFASVRAHLAPGGRFMLDVFNPHPHYLVRDSEERLPVSCYKDPRGKEQILVEEQYSYDRAAQVSRITWHYIRGRKRFASKRLNMRCFFPQELDALLRYNGFKILKKYGDFNLEPFTGASSKQIVICRKT
ncbi:MAG: hypothetical protein A2270_09850 [Elusimicrobia bacterium RIFOXYA12_FULL_51_18]|nr:MAG: hypothetical protein A2270_09850 [Elusimicrobia bacterium RIFOXYA12_FULL_51_18]OGS32406.1 MAG: hypothetical protein A2218_02290 [Elusimicrobia bacterium RIFOXYA2_FULL_53_38]